MTGKGRSSPGDPASTVPGSAGGGPLDRPRLWERAVSASRDGLVITGPLEDDCPIIYVNPAFERLCGYTAGELLGYNCRFLQDSDRDQPALEGLRAALREGREYTGVLRNYHKDGSLIWNELSISPVRDASGRVTNFVEVQNDITARVRAEEDSRQSEERLRSVLVQYGSDMITVLEPDGTPRYESPAVERTLGYRHMEVVGEDLFELVHPEDVERLAEVSAATLRTPGESPPVEFRMRHADGSWRYFESIGNNLTENPDVRGIVVVTRNITEGKEDEQALRESEERFRQLFEQAVDSLIVHDERGKILDVNSETCRTLGYSREEMLSLHVHDLTDGLLTEEEKLVQERDGGTVWQRIVAGAPETMSVTRVSHHKRKDGTTFPVEVRVGSVDYGGRRRILASVRDVTEKKGSSLDRVG